MIDWQLIRAEYESGILTVRDIAHKHKVDKKYIWRKRRAQNWKKPEVDVTQAKSSGLFSVQYFTDEALEIIDELMGEDPKDLLWKAIMILYASIIRAQKIMNVKSINDHSLQYSENLQYAWDKQRGFIDSQAKAMQSLASMIQQYERMTDEATKRELEIEALRWKLAEMKGEIETNDDDGFLQALSGSVEDIWNEEN